MDVGSAEEIAEPISVQLYGGPIHRRACAWIVARLTRLVGPHWEV